MPKRCIVLVVTLMCALPACTVNRLRNVDLQVTDARTGEPFQNLLIESEHFGQYLVPVAMNASSQRSITDDRGVARVPVLRGGDGEGSTLTIWLPPAGTAYEELRRFEGSRIRQSLFEEVWDYDEASALDWKRLGMAVGLRIVDNEFVLGSSNRGGKRVEVRSGELFPAGVFSPEYQVETQVAVRFLGN
ncbi:MAG: hypothetical protein ACF8Q5_09825 [Phycisphaerales bacterium JB040]